MDISIRITIHDPQQSYNGLEFSQDGQIKSPNFAEVAEVMSAFHQLFERLREKFPSK